jgi:hypothetical protein
MYNEKKIRKSELLQLILLDNLYAQSGSERIIFQGGTALRLIYTAMRFSEDPLKRPFWIASIIEERFRHQMNLNWITWISTSFQK